MVSTTLRAGFSARLEIPVLKFIEVISRIAVPQLLFDGTTFTDRSVYEVEQVCILVDRKAAACELRFLYFDGMTYRLAALAVSITLPPPTLRGRT